MKYIKPKEPKLSTLILTASSGIMLGVLLGTSLLLSRAATTVTAAPSEAELSRPGNYNTYYIPGRSAGTESTNLRSGVGRITRRTPGPISFGEDEVNFFVQRIEFGEVAASSDEQNARVGKVNFRISGDQITASLKVVVDPNGSPFEILAVANVSFENTDAGPELQVSNLRVNSLPIPGFGGLISSMIESKLAQTPWPEDLVEMWQNIRSIQVETGKLITEVGLRRA